MSAMGVVGDGGGDTLAVDEAGELLKTNLKIECPVHHQGSEGEGPCTKQSAETDEKREDKPSLVENLQNAPKTFKHLPHRRLEDQRHLLQFDYPQQSKPTKRTTAPSVDRFSDEEMESSPLIEDRGKDIRLKRQQQYREELAQQIAQREEQRTEQKAKRNQRAARRYHENASVTAGATAARSAHVSVDQYERQLRLEQIEGMRRQLELQREREVQRLRRIYRKDDRKFLAHLQRLKLQDSPPYVMNDNRDVPQRELGFGADPRPPPSSRAQQETKLQVTRSMPEATQGKHDAAKTDDLGSKVVPLKTSQKVSPRVSQMAPPIPPSGKRLQKKEVSDTGLKAQQPLSTSTTRTTDKTNKPVSVKQAYLRLQQQRRADEQLLDEKRAQAAAWKADIARQQRLEKDVRNLAEWRAGHSLAGVPLAPISPALRNRYEAAASWLKKQRAAHQEKRAERDRQLISWREEKDRQTKERRLKEKAEQKVAIEMQAERRKEAEKCYQRWMLEIRARKIAERASVPRGATGASTYSSAYSLPSPWRPPPKQVWRGKNFKSASANVKKEDVTQKVL